MNKKVKGFIAVGMVAMLMTACSGKPSKDEIVKAIKEGRMSTQTVLEDKLMTEEELIEAGVMDIVEAVNKIDIAPKLNNFKSIDTNGNEVTEEFFKSIENGTRVVFWRTDNEESVQEIKELNDVYKNAKEAEAEILGIILDIENKEKAEEICKEIEFTNIFFTDSMKETMGESGMGMLESIPTTNEADKDGNMIFAWTRGVSDKEALKKAYEEKKQN